MALQKLDIQDPWASLGSELGKGVGAGITGGIEALTQHKLQELQRQRASQGLMAIKDIQGQQLFNPQEAQSLIHADPKLVQQYVKQRMQQAQQQQFDNYLYGAQQSQGQPAPSNNMVQAGGIAGQVFPQQPIQQRPQEPRSPMTLPTPRGITPQQLNQFNSVRSAQQAKIDASNKPFINEFHKGVDTARQMYDLVQEMKNLRATGKVATGAKGAFLPLWAQSAETQEYNAKANELATLLASSQRGVPSAYKIRVAQSTKPSIEQALKAQKGLEESIEKKALAILNRGEIFNQIIQENGGFQPPNISSIIDARAASNRDITQQNEPVQQLGQQPQGRFDNESPLGTIGRGLVRTGVRAAEGALEQLPGIANLGLGAANLATGGNVPTYNELREKFPYLPPTEFAPAINELTGGYTAPQNEVEKFIDNVANFAGGVAGAPVGIAGKALSFLTNPARAAKIARFALPFSRLPWQKALKLGLVGEAAGKTIEFFGGGPLAQSVGKIASMMAASTPFGKGAMLKTAGENYEKASVAAANKTVNIAAAEAKLNELARNAAKGFDPNKKIIEDIIHEAQTAINSHKLAGKPHQIPVNSLVDLKQQANKWYQATEFPRVSGEKHVPKDAKKIIGSIIDTLNKPIKEFGIHNPEFGEPYALAEDLYKGVKDTGLITKFIEEHAPKLGLSSTVAKLLLSGVGAAGAAATKTLPLAVAGAGLIKGGETIQLLVKHPAARKHYLSALQAAANNNKAAFVREARILDKEIS